MLIGFLGIWWWYSPKLITMWSSISGEKWNNSGVFSAWIWLWCWQSFLANYYGPSWSNILPLNFFRSRNVQIYILLNNSIPQSHIWCLLIKSMTWQTCRRFILRVCRLLNLSEIEILIDSSMECIQLRNFQILTLIHIPSEHINCWKKLSQRSPFLLSVKA